ncbi:MAG: right-handed parallel beta-helix repeat-containing protein [Kiritimatiellae bacterium]|nr:right-handed parallel beta-helix repeat-containing protein [Kiritimatiellia bacterium]
MMYTVAILASALATGCPDFVVEPPRAHSANVVRAVDFGFSAASDKNAAAINRALEEAHRIGASKVELAPGTYRCFDEPGVVIRDFRDFVFDGKGAVLVFRRAPEYRCQPQSEVIHEKGNLLVQRCVRTEVRDFIMDWDWEADPLAAYVKVAAKHVDEKDGAKSFVDLAFVDWDRYPKYPDPVPVQMIMPMDRDKGRFRVGVVLICGATEGHFGAKNEWVAPNVLRVWPGIPMPERNQNPATGFRYSPTENLSRVKKLEENGFYRLQHAYYGKNGVILESNTHLTVRNVAVWSCFGLAMLVDGAQEFWHVENFSVAPPDEAMFKAAYPTAKYRPRPVSSVSDGHHVARSKGSCRYVNCRWSLNNDDAMNFHDRFTIAARVADKVLEVINRRGADYFRATPGAEIELRKPNFAPTGFRAKIVKIAGNRLHVDHVLPPQEGPCFLVWDRTYGTDRVLIKDCVFEDVSWRNVFSSSDLTISGCTFRRMNANPVCLIADYRCDRWCEGMGVTNVVIRDCIFEDNGTLVPDMAQISTVCVTPEEWDVGRISPSFVGGRMLIEGCSFIRPRGPVLDLSCGKDVIFRNNRIVQGKSGGRADAGTMKVAPAVEGFREENTSVVHAHAPGGGSCP